MVRNFNRLTMPMAFSFVLAVLSNGAALAQVNYKVGDRIEKYGEYGTVVEIGAPIYGGGNFLMVHMDKMTSPESRMMVDPVHNPSFKLATGAPPAANAGGGGRGNGGGFAPNPANAMPAANLGAGTNAVPAGQDIQVSPNAPPSEETFKNVLRANIPQPGWGDTITLQFQQFNLSGPMNHVVRYAGHLNQETILGGPGRTVQAWQANVKYVQLTHYKDPYADDQAVTKTGMYWFYKDQSGHWLAEDENVQLSPTQYIHKR